MEQVGRFVVLPVYRQLKILNIGGNQLVSVEPLAHARMESLE